MRSSPRLAAATGVLFVAAIAAVAIIGEIKDFQFSGDYALRASNEVFGTTQLLTGFAAAFFFWFASTLAARVRQLEGGSGRLAAAVNGSGAIIAGLLALSVSIEFGARSGGSADLAALATALLDGPGLFFPAAVLIGASALVALRAEGLPAYSTNVARVSVLLSAAFIAGAGLQLFNNYAWINDTAYIAFLAWVLVLSVIGFIRWKDMDASAPARRAAPAAPPAAAPAPAPAEAPPARKPRPRRKAAPRKR
jgi:hypothetical protein